MSKDTTTRVLSALVGLVVFFIIVFLTPMFFYIALGAVILFMLFELLHALKLGFILISTSLVASAAVIYSTLNAQYDTLAFVIISYMSILIIESIFFHKKISFEDITKTLFATLYISIFTTFIGRMRYIDEFGIYYLCLIFTSSWMSDTGAYFMGRFFGRRKLAPDISPKKTVAGSIGGIIFSVISSAILGAVAAFLSNAQPNYLALTLIGALGSYLSQIGDLVASLIKRGCGIKDFGNIMPGHGGMLDRFDSVILVAPFVFFICMYLKDCGLSIL